MLRSRYSLTFTPDGFPEGVLPVCRFGSILADDVSREWSSSVETAPRLGSPWAWHHDGGGRYLTISLTVFERYATTALADAARADRQDLLNLHPDGVLEERFGFEGGVATGSRLWRATVESCNPVAIDPEQAFGLSDDPAFAEFMAADDAPAEAGTVWRGMAYTFICTPLES